MPLTQAKKRKPEGLHDAEDPDHKQAVPKVMYLLKQVFRTSGDSHTSYVELGIYSSEEKARRAAELFERAHPMHPDTPYRIFAWPCELDSEAHNDEDEYSPKIRNEGFYLTH